MTSHANPAARTLAPTQLEDALLDLLRAEPRTSEDLARITAYAGSTIRSRLGILRTRGLVYRESQLCANGHGMCFIWHMAPDGEVAASTLNALTARDRGGAGIGRPHQVTVKTYPAIDRRDPLVESLFGRASRGASC